MAAIRFHKVVPIATVASCLLISACSKNIPFLYPAPGPKAVHITHSLLRYDTLPYREADIIWTIDNSESMLSKHHAVRTNAFLFMEGFLEANQDLRWRMGLISSTIDEEPFIGFTPSTALDYRSKNPVEAFQGAVDRLGNRGDTDEKTFLPLLKHLTNHPYFIRPKADLIIISTADEDENEATKKIEPREFVKKLRGLVGRDKRIFTFGILATVQDGCGKNTIDFPKSRWKEYLDLTQGRYFPMCQKSFGETLKELGQILVQKAMSYSTRIVLHSRPLPASLEIHYGDLKLAPGIALEGGLWEYDAEAGTITIHNPLDFLKPGLDSIEIDYQEAP
ncbi:hypothetical protein K2X30_04975 [bacterium]|jgi:hypothetical protein|nr:hypothetical protein [bacterium]